METTNDSMMIKPQLTRAAGLDIHKKKIVVCFYVAGETQEIKEYNTFTKDLEQLRDDMLGFQPLQVFLPPATNKGACRWKKHLRKKNLTKIQSPFDKLGL